MTDYSTTETTAVEYDNAGRVTKTTVVTEYVEKKTDLTPQPDAGMADKPLRVNPSWSPMWYEHVSPYKYEVFCTANASVYDLDKARARKTS